MQYIREIFKKIYQKIPKFLKTKRAILAVFILLILVFLGSRGSADENKIKTTQVERQTIRSEIISSGKIASYHESSLHFAVGGKVVWVGVEEWDYVKKGQVIATLDRETYEIALRQAQQDVIAADAELERLYDDLKKQSGAENYDNRVRRTAAEAKKNKAFDDVKKAERDLKSAVLNSPINGTIVKLNINSQEEILVTTEVAKIADTQNIYFTAEVDDTDIGKVKEGQETIITLDAFPEDELKSQVESIGAESITTSTGATVFEVKFNLTQSSDYRIGMNGEARIITQEQSDSLIVPIEAIVDEKYVWIKTDSTFEKKEVVKGIESDSEIEIISGLSRGETVTTAGFDQIGRKSLFQKILSLFKK